MPSELGRRYESYESHDRRELRDEGWDRCPLKLKELLRVQDQSRARKQDNDHAKPQYLA